MGKEETSYVVQNIILESTSTYKELIKSATQKTRAERPKID